MKLAFACRSYNRKGGISRSVCELAERLARDNEVHVFAHSWDQDPASRPGIIFHKVFMVTWPFPLAVLSFAILSYLAVKKHQFDLTIVPLGDGLKADIFYAHSCHRSWVEIKKKTSGELLKFIFNPLHRIILLLEKINLRPGNYRKIISISALTRDDLLKYYRVPPADIVVIYNGVNIAEFTPANKEKYRRQSREELGLTAAETVLIFAANEFKRKGLKNLLAAAALPMKNFPLKLLVLGGDSQLPYKAQARQLGIEDKVLFLGLRKEISKYYAASDVFVFPSLLEPFGLVITEAMASGLAVITSRLAGAAELITDGETGLLLKNPENVGELQDKIFKLVKDGALRNAMGTKAALSVASYSWDRIAGQTREYYQQVIEEKQAGDLN